MKIVRYAGERISPFGKIVQLFKDRAGRHYLYSGIRNVSFGCCYRLEPGDKMKIRPEEVDMPKGWSVDPSERIEYEAQKEVVKSERLRRRKALELKKPHADIVRAVALLKPFYRSLGLFDQERFVKYLENQMSLKPNRRGRK